MTNVPICPINGWKIENTPAGYGVLTITTLPFDLKEMKPADPETIEEARHFGIAAEQAESLGRDLIRMAVELREKRKSSN